MEEEHHALLSGATHRFGRLVDQPMSRGAVRRKRNGRLGWAAAAVALTGASLLAAAHPAAAEVVEPAGACVATGAWSDGDFTVSSADADPGRVIEIPRADVVAWTGEVVGPQPGEPRPIAGAIELRLPPPLSNVTVDSWQGTGVNVDSSGTRTYDLPAVVPAGVVFTLHGEHREGDLLHCSGTASLRIAGGPFDSPLIWAALAGTVLSGALALLAGRATRPTGSRRIGPMVTGALLTSVFLLFASVTLVLFGVVPLASPLLTLAPLAGLAGGAAWARWAPLGTAKVAS